MAIGDGAFAYCNSLTVIVPKGSYAEEYVQTNGIPYTYSDGLD